MKKWKSGALRLFRPGAGWTLLLTILSAGALALVFTRGWENTPGAYAAYLLSAYTLVSAILTVPGAVVKGREAVAGHRLGSRYLTDLPFRSTVSLHLSLGVNLVFAVFKLVSAILYSSLWFGAVAVYYMVLCVVRFSLLRYLRKDVLTLRQELLEYRRCGFLLFALNIALTGMVYQMVVSGQGYRYPGYMIYVVALYAFYMLVIAIVNIFKYRKLERPILTASKILNLATALVALYTLQTAMFAAFGGETSALFQQGMNAVSGGVILLLIFGLAVYMVVSANRRIKQMDRQQR